MSQVNIDNFILPRIVKCSEVTAVEPSHRRSSYNGEISISKTFSFRNGLPWPVTMVELSGVATTIPPLPGIGKSTDCLEVEVRYSFNHQVNFDVYHLLSESNKTVSPELKALQEHVQQGRITPMSNNEFVISYRLSKDKLFPSSPPVHIKEINHTFYIRKEFELKQVIHPYSDLGERLMMQINSIGSFHYGIEIVDPDNICGERFINIANHIFRVVPIRSSHKEPGVYVSLTLGSEVQLEDGPDFIQDYYSFKEAAEHLHLFKSAQEAAELGDLKEIATRRKLEIEERISENKLEQITRDRTVKDVDYAMTLEAKAIAKLENDYKQSMLELKTNAARVESELIHKTQEYNLVKMERDAMLNNMAFKQSIQKADRNDMSEMIKWVPLIALAFGAVVKSLL